VLGLTHYHLVPGVAEVVSEVTAEKDAVYKDPGPQEGLRSHDEASEYGMCGEKMPA
jgi:hypothetical protein